MAETVTISSVLFCCTRADTRSSCTLSISAISLLNDMAAHFNSYDDAAVAYWASQIPKSPTTMLARNAYKSPTSLPVPNIPNRNTLSSSASTNTADDIGTSFRTQRDQTPYPSTAYRLNTLSSNGFTNSGGDIGTPVNCQREDTPFPSYAYYSSSSSGSSSALSDAPDSDLDEAPRLSRPGSFTSLRNATSSDPSNQPALSRRASALSLPDAPPHNPATTARRSSMSKAGTNSEKLRLNVSFDLSRSTQLPPPPVEIALLPNAYSRSKTFILSYADINGMTDANRPKQCRPMFALHPPPYLSAEEKKDYGKFLQSMSSSRVVHGKGREEYNANS